MRQTVGVDQDKSVLYLGLCLCKTFWRDGGYESVSVVDTRSTEYE